MHPFAGVNFIRKGMGYEAFLIKEARENPLAAPVLKQAEALFGDLFTKLEEYAK